MKMFPEPTWDPGPEEYFAAKAPDGKPLHGSSTVKRFAASPRVYRDQLGAQMAAEIELAGGLLMSPLARALVDEMKPKPFMNFGSAVEVVAFASDEAVPETGKRLVMARLRAEQIRSHPVAGPYLKGEGSRLQVSHRWLDSASGLWLRLRFDCCYWAGSPPAAAVLDTKVWSRVTARNMRHKVRDNGADTQAAIYRRGSVDLWDERPPHTLVVADPRITGKIFVRTLPEKMIADADTRLSFTLDRLAEAYATNDFSDPEECNQEL